MNETKRRRAVGLVAAVVVAIAALRLLRGIPNELDSAVPSTAEHSGHRLVAAAAQRAHQVTQPTTSPPGVAASPPPPAAGNPKMVSLADATVEEYRARARYPRWSQPIADAAHDPILVDRQVSPNVARGPDGEDPSLTVFPDQVSFESPDPIIIYAYLSVGGTPVPPASISGAVMTQQGDTVAPLPFSDSGSDGDSQAGDFVYTAEVRPAELPASLNGIYLVRIHAVTANDGDRIGTTAFQYSHPDAQLTGRYVDALKAGNLEIQAEVQVTAAGRFHLEATLYGERDSPLAWAQNALELTPGTHWIPLTFFGMILHDRGEAGPYVLRFVALSSTTDMPNAKNRLVENAYTTGAYAAAAFSAQPFNDPNLLETVRRLQEMNRFGSPPPQSGAAP